MQTTKLVFTLSLLISFTVSSAQESYKDSLRAFIKNYTDSHLVVTGDDKKLMRFFPVDRTYRVVAQFERITDGKWFSMETSGKEKKVFRAYGIVHFAIRDTAIRMNIYQSQNLMTIGEYKEYLFLPFTDLTTGEETYALGRYIDLTFKDIVDNKVVIDFNKAYNPACAYVSGKYNCPIPPKENSLNVAILAGEKNYGKKH